MMTDTIADMLTRIRNGQMAGKRQVSIPFSKLKLAIVEILHREGYVAGVNRVDAKPVAQLVVELKYNGKEPAIQAIDRASKPGHRMYRKADELPTVLSGYGTAVVSTSRGMMTVTEAKKLGLGGEVICTVY